jgi:hypothetical protein
VIYSVRMSILELSGNFGNLKILRFAIQKWYQKSAVAAVRKQFAVRHSAHASCKRFLGMCVHYLLFILLIFCTYVTNIFFFIHVFITIYNTFKFLFTNLTKQLNNITAFLIINRPFKSTEKKKERKKIELFICELLRIP